MPFIKKDIKQVCKPREVFIKINECYLTEVHATSLFFSHLKGLNRVWSKKSYFKIIQFCEVYKLYFFVLLGTQK